MVNPEAAKRNFNMACEQYNKAKDIIRELSSFVQMAQKDFSFEKSMKQFDLILQAILLRSAAEDGHFLDEEKQFIDKITDYADLMSFISQKHNIDVSWDTFKHMDSEDRKDIAIKMVVELDDLAQNFVLPFAVIDAILPKDYCNELTEAMNLIGACLAACDGDSTESPDFKKEIIVSFALVQKSIKEKWEEIVATAEQKKSVPIETNASRRAASLKDVYLKKNK